jgi:hypothetical protein
MESIERFHSVHANEETPVERLGMAEDILAVGDQIERELAE